MYCNSFITSTKHHSVDDAPRVAVIKADPNDIRNIDKATTPILTYINILNQILSNANLRMITM